MVRNTSDGSGRAPRLTTYMNMMAIEGLPAFSQGPRTPDLSEQLQAIRAGGYDGVQFIAPTGDAEAELCARLGLGRCSLGRVNVPEEAEELAARFADEGQECGTLHLGWGLEDDEAAARLIEAVLAASEKYGVPLYVETHRATIFQDMWRTAGFVERFPELRFNGDFSHWYTGQEMVYGGFERKLAFIGPVLERVRFLHGRIGNPGSIQVDVGEGSETGRPFVSHFRQLWTAAFRGFLASAAAGDYICFVPELLAPRIYYARQFPGPDGQPCEESDRWEQSQILARIAREAFALARDGC